MGSRRGVRCRSHGSIRHLGPATAPPIPHASLSRFALAISRAAVHETGMNLRCLRRKTWTVTLFLSAPGPSHRVFVSPQRYLPIPEQYQGGRRNGWLGQGQPDDLGRTSGLGQHRVLVHPSGSAARCPASPVASALPMSQIQVQHLALRFGNSHGLCRVREPLKRDAPLGRCGEGDDFPSARRHITDFVLAAELIRT